MDIAQKIKDAQKCADLLKLAGQKVELNEQWGVVMLHLRLNVYYVDFPENIQYGILISDFRISGEEYNGLVIKICVNHIVNYTLKAHINYVVLFNKMYKNDRIVGRLYQHCIIDNKHYNLKNLWSLYYTIEKNKTNKYEQIKYDEEHLLNVDFTPYKPAEIDILNKGFKRMMIKLQQIDKLGHYNFTVIGHPPDNWAIIVEGDFSLSGRNDVFQYVNEGGELFAFVYEDNGECALASNKQIIPGVLISGLQLEKQGDLYGGFMINGDLTKLYCFAYDDDEDDEDEDSISLHSIRIFRYGDIFFSYDTNLNIIELEARPPVSGNRTKAALSGDLS